jgi:HEAT repeat protein
VNDSRSFNRFLSAPVGPVSVGFVLLGLTVVVPFTGCVQSSQPSSIEQTVSVLIGLLSDESADIRTTAVESLGKIGDGAAILPVIDRLSDPSAPVRAAAATAAGRLGASSKEKVVPLLLHALYDSNDTVKRAAAEALGELEPTPEFLGSMPDLLTSSDVGIRRAAMLTLLQIESTRWLASLYQALQDADPLVRQRAVAILGETGIQTVLPPIRERLTRDRDPAVRAEAAYRLRTVSDVETRTVLKKVSEADSDPMVRRWARPE